MTGRKLPAGHVDWTNDVLPVGAGIVRSYNTNVTLRQLFYRLVSLPQGGTGPRHVDIATRR